MKGGTHRREQECLIRYVPAEAMYQLPTGSNPLFVIAGAASGEHEEFDH